MVPPPVAADSVTVTPNAGIAPLTVDVGDSVTLIPLQTWDKEIVTLTNPDGSQTNFVITLQNAVGPNTITTDLSSTLDTSGTYVIDVGNSGTYPIGLLWTDLFGPFPVRVYNQIP
jgi:hypothetical protein